MYRSMASHQSVALCLQGNALLVGVGGSGKQSLAKLAAFMAGCDVFEITLTRGYDEVMFREDLKQLYTMIGADNKKVRSLRVPLHPVSPDGWQHRSWQTSSTICSCKALTPLLVKIQTKLVWWPTCLVRF